MSHPGRPIPDDWYPGRIPANVELAEDVYIDSSYGFALFLSERIPGLTIGRASGVYNRSNFLVGPEGLVSIGEFTCLNNTYIVCEDRVRIGDHCLLSWGVVISDTASVEGLSLDGRRTALTECSQHPDRWLSIPGLAKPVTVEDNVWVGFDSVITAGVTLGRGSVVGGKSVVMEDIPPYAVAVGNPARVVRYLDPDDTEESRAKSLSECVRGRPG